MTNDEIRFAVGLFIFLCVVLLSGCSLAKEVGDEELGGLDIYETYGGEIEIRERSGNPGARAARGSLRN